MARPADLGDNPARIVTINIINVYVRHPEGPIDQEAAELAEGIGALLVSLAQGECDKIDCSREWEITIDLVDDEVVLDHEGEVVRMFTPQSAPDAMREWLLEAHADLAGGIAS